MADTRSFSATVDAWVKTSKARMEAVFKESTKRTVALAQSRVPIDTGYLHASVRASLQAMPPTIEAKGKGERVIYDASEVLLVIASARLGQTIYVGWTANYAIYIEYGHSKRAPNGFVRISAMEWPRIVSEVTVEAKARVAANG